MAKKDLGIVGFKGRGSKKNPIFGERLHDGSLLLSAIKSNQLKHQRFMGYSKKTAIQKFKKVM